MTVYQEHVGEAESFRGKDGLNFTNLWKTASKNVGTISEKF